MCCYGLPGPCGGGCCGNCGPYGVGSDECCSRELRAGVMYTNCDCWKRNGLQDQCPRGICRFTCCCPGAVCCGGGCCPSSYPLKFAYMTHGIDNRRMRCRATAACCPKPYPYRCQTLTYPSGKTAVLCPT